MISFCHIVSVLFNFQVSYIGQDCREIPEHLGRDCGHFAKRLDLSFNLLRYVAFARHTPGLGGSVALVMAGREKPHILALHRVPGSETYGPTPRGQTLLRVVLW